MERKIAIIQRNLTKQLISFVKGLSIIPIMGSVRKYAELKVKLRKKGTPMHDEFDLIIGVTAIVNKLTFVTDNIKDFRHLEDLKIENWFDRK